MPSIKQLQEERAPIGNEIKRMADTLGAGKPDFNAEERSRWDRLNADFNRLTNQIEVARGASNVDAEFGSRGSRAHDEHRRIKPGLEDTVPRSMRRSGRHRTEVAEELHSLALQAWFRRQQELDLTDDHKRACKALGLNPSRKVLEIRLDRRPGADVQRRAQSAQLPSTGGSLVAGGRFMGSIEKALKDDSGPREVADVMRTDDGAPMPWPTSDDTSNEGELVGENREVSTQDAKVGVTNFGAYKYSSKLMKVPSELMDDSEFDLDTFIGELLGERIGRAQNRHFTSGRGSSEPQGVVTGSKLGKTAANATSLAADEIIDLIHSVDPAYRRDPSFRLMFHDSILAIIRKLKDGQGRYLFEEGQNGAPDKIKGVRYVINQNRDDESGLASG